MMYRAAKDEDEGEAVSIVVSSVSMIEGSVKSMRVAEAQTETGAI